jgi:hypothetical protein
MSHHFAATTLPGEQSPWGKAEDLYHGLRGSSRGALLPFAAHTRALINHLAGFHGVEYLGVHSRAGKVVRYCNAGDVYAPTLFFMGRRLFVSTVGDLVETRRVRVDVWPNT